MANKIGEHAKLYSYKELQTATENFSPANKIGQGGFGSVFKVIMTLRVYVWFAI